MTQSIQQATGRSCWCSLCLAASDSDLPLPFASEPIPWAPLGFIGPPEVLRQLMPSHCSSLLPQRPFAAVFARGR